MRYFYVFAAPTSGIGCTTPPTPFESPYLSPVSTDSVLEDETVDYVCEDGRRFLHDLEAVSEAATCLSNNQWDPEQPGWQCVESEYHSKQ